MTSSSSAGTAGPVAAVPATVTPTPVGLHGSVAAFDPSQEEWSEYTERILHYFTANDISSPEKRRAILLNVVGPTTYRLLKTLASPAAVTELTFDQLVERAKKHFNPKPSPIIKRFEFNTRRQEEGETVAVFVAELRKIAQYCEYGDALSDMLRDRVVCGISNKSVQRRLLQETSLTFDKALEMTLAAETAAKDSRRLADTHTPDKTSDGLPKVNRAGSVSEPAAVQKIDNTRHKNASPGLWGNKGRDCHRCGGKHHPSKCTFREYECHYCKKRGHLAKVCKKRNTNKSEQANVVLSEDQTRQSEYAMFHIKQSGSSRPLEVSVIVNGNPLRMEVDTGASVSIINSDTFDRIRVGKSTLNLHETATELRTYTGESIEVAGSTTVQVEHNGQTVSLPIIVVKGNGPSLLGRDWLRALRLDWRSIFRVDATTHTLETILEKHSEVFKKGLGTLQGVSAKIYVDQNAQPRFHSPRPVPFALRKKVEEELERLQSLRVIKPIQFSDWAAPIVPVLKGDGRIRICGDYKVTINQAAKVDKYPLPKIDEIFASLSGGKTFTKLDLSHAYLQVPLHEKSQDYVTINTHKGLFRYQRLPFRVASAPSIFQRVMENLLQGIKGVSVYIDDILITGTTKQEHLSNIGQVLQRLEKAGMRLKKEKCAFLLPSVSYLGHIISAEGLHTSDTKVKAVIDAPAPQDVAGLRAFLGMVNYYSKFLPDLATTLAPLYSLLHKSTPWKWGQQQRKAFQEVKDLLRSRRVLAHFNDQLPLVLECDASPYGLGAVLSHRMPDGTERPIGFASRTLTKAERNYSHLDKEALSIIFAVKKYHQYVYGRSFVIKTDHKPLIHILGESRATPVMASGRLQRWALTLGAYSYVIEHRAGKDNANADALSRLPLPPDNVHATVPKPEEIIHLMESLDASPLSSAQIKIWTERDPLLAKVRRCVKNGWPAQISDEEQDLAPYYRRRCELSVEDGCILWGYRVVIPERGRKRALRMLHEAHPGVVRMKRFARGYMWWPGIDGGIEQCVKECVVCQTSRKSPPVAPLSPWAWPEKPWSRVHIDYAGPFKGKMFLLLIDAYSKWLDVHITDSSTSNTTIELLRKSFAALGLPEVIVSDNATAFTSREFTEFLSKNGVRHIRTPPYHPASNGLVERAVQTLKESMKRLTSDSLSTKLSRFLFRYRITPHSTTGVSPSELMYGRTLRSHFDLLHPDLSSKVRKSQDRQKSGHDKRSRFREFNIGDSVYAKNYGSGPGWLPGKVVEVVGAVLFTVLLEDGRQIRRHAEQLQSRVDGTQPGQDRSHTLSNADGESEQDSEIMVSCGTTGEGPGGMIETDIVVPEPPASESEVTASASGAEATDSSEATDQDTESSVRRSTRVRHPPIRFGEQLFQVH